MPHLDRYLTNPSGHFHLLAGLVALFCDAMDALRAMPVWERGLHLFWLAGPFFLLIERTPADAWLTIVSLAFVIRTIITRDTGWLQSLWVRAGFVFWFWCIIAGAISSAPGYSIGEALIWFRFPLFAMATAFWFGRDRRLLYAMLLSTALGLMIMCGILTAEILMIGHQNGRLSWPYGDLVPGNYVAKVGLPALVVMVALAVSIRGRLAALSAVLALMVVIISLFAGERINFLILACGGLLAGLVWKPRPARYLGLIVTGVLGSVAAGYAFPQLASRFSDKLIAGVTSFETSVWWHTLNGGWVVARDNWLFGIGTGNYRHMALDLLEGVPFTKYDPHPHNFYLQMLVETGIIGLVLGSFFLWSIIAECFRAGLRNRGNVMIATAFVVPLAVFWPIATSADLFGQWNNIFMWSGVALALGVCTSSPAQK